MVRDTILIKCDYKENALICNNQERLYIPQTLRPQAEHWCYESSSAQRSYPDVFLEEFWHIKND